MGEYLHFRYLKCLVTLGATPLKFQHGILKNNPLEQQMSFLVKPLFSMWFNPWPNLIPYLEVTYNLTIKNLGSLDSSPNISHIIASFTKNPDRFLQEVVTRAWKKNVHVAVPWFRKIAIWEISMEISTSVRLIEPSYGGVWLSIAGFWDLQTTSFEIPWFLGLFYSSKFPHIVRIVRSLEDWIYWIEVSCWPPSQSAKNHETSIWREEGWKWLADEHAANTWKTRVDSCGPKHPLTAEMRWWFC